MKLRYEITTWGVVLGSCLGLLVQGAVNDGLTNDEIIYLAAGQLQVQKGDFRLNPSHPPLASTLIGLGLLGAKLETPPLPQSMDPLAYSYRFVHVENNASVVILRGRAPVIVLALGLVALIGLWARRVAGPWGALIALPLAAFHPSLLAHGHLATTDVPAAFFMAATALAFDHWLGRPSPLRSSAFGAFLGLALATRVTVVLLLPAVALALLVQLVRQRNLPWVSRLRDVMLLAVTAAGLVPTLLWASYFFRDQPWPEGIWRMPQASGVVARAVDAASATGVVPEAWLRGVRFQIEHSHKGHPGFLLGEHSKTGFAHFGLVAFAVKNTPGFLLLVALALGLGVARRWVPWTPSAVLLLGLVVTVFAATSLSRLQIGERYLLPMYAPLIVLIAWATRTAFTARWVRATLVVALALHVVPTALQARHGFLPYFNLLAGGRDGGHRFLLDSSLDWGQDLPRLAQWMRREHVQQVQLAYHGVDDPSRFGITREDLPGIVLYPSYPPALPFSGVVAVSPNLLLGLVGRAGEPYAWMRRISPDDRAGVFFIYRRLDSPHPEAR